MSEEYKKNYEKYLKIANKIKDREERSFIVCFLISEGKKKAEKEIEELKAKIEKMRNCENCKHNLETFPFCDSSSCDEDTLINWEFGK